MTNGRSIADCRDSERETRIPWLIPLFRWRSNGWVDNSTSRQTRPRRNGFVKVSTLLSLEWIPDLLLFVGCVIFGGFVVNSRLLLHHIQTCLLTILLAGLWTVSGPASSSLVITWAVTVYLYTTLCCEYSLDLLQNQLLNFHVHVQQRLLVWKIWKQRFTASPNLLSPAMLFMQLIIPSCSKMMPSRSRKGMIYNYFYHCMCHEIPIHFWYYAMMYAFGK